MDVFEDPGHPHKGQPVLEKGVKPEEAEAAVILIHGRGATAQSIMTLSDELKEPGICWLAPQASYHTWYPYSFLTPVEQNEPGLSSALTIIAELVDRLLQAGVPRERMVIAGFSQGACLALEFAARNPARYGGVVALSGGLIGAHVLPAQYTGSMNRTPVFLGCSDFDHHIPEERVHASAHIFESLGASVTCKIYEELGHTINENELKHFRTIIKEAKAKR